jgi:hypothetical protein
MAWVGVGVDLNRPRDRDSQARLNVGKREPCAILPVARRRNSWEKPQVTRASYTGVFSTSPLHTSRFDPLGLFGRRRRWGRQGRQGRRRAAAAVGSAATAAGAAAAEAAAAAATAAGGSHYHRGSGRAQPKGCLRPLRSMGGGLGLWSGWAASSC